LIVEGYADLGPVDERYLKARRRAYLTREYIVGRYFRDPNYTGFIGLANVSPRDVADDEAGDGTREAGVVLALYYDEESPRTPRHRAIQ
jgi:hypothetical protein